MAGNPATNAALDQRILAHQRHLKTEASWSATDWWKRVEEAARKEKERADADVPS